LLRGKPLCLGHLLADFEAEKAVTERHGLHSAYGLLTKNLQTVGNNMSVLSC